MFHVPGSQSPASSIRSTPLGRGLLCAVLLAPTGLAQTFTVNTTSDTVDANPGDGICADANGLCSLRAAIQEANATGGGVSIRLQAGLVYPLTLAGAGEDAGATGDLDVTGLIDLLGRGATVDALGADRAFDVHAPGRLRVSKLSVRSGSVMGESGGGYRSDNILHLSNSSVQNCSATGAGASGGGVFNDGGELILTRCVLSGGDATRAGGAVEANGGSTTIEESVILENHAGPSPGNGGGLHLTGAGTVNVSSSNFRFNVADSEGGALWNSSTGDMSVLDATIYSNQALGADSTNGGGGLFNDGGTLSVSRSRVRENLAPMGSGSGGGFLNDGGTLNVTLCTVHGNSSMRAGGGFEANAGTTNLFNSAVYDNSTGDAPGNGGGLHLTGAGVVSVGLCDFENNSAGAEGGGLWNSAVGSMSVASSAVLGNVASGADADQGGGGLFNDGGSLTVTNSLVADNSADGASGSGGGVLNREGFLSVAGTRFERNAARRAGGGVEASAGTTDLDQVVFIENQCGPAPGNGGALHLTGPGNVSFDDCVARNNSAAAEGGAFWNSAVGTMTLSGCDIDGNVASGADPDQGGGGVFNDGGTMTIEGGVISNNAADGAAGSGGGALNLGGNLDVSMTTFSDNRSQRAGGAIEASSGTTNLFRVRMHGNLTGAAPGNGGGLHLTGPGMVSIGESAVTANMAANEGGGLWNSATGTMVVTDSRFRANEAPTGPEVFNDGGSFTVDGVPVAPGP